MKCPKCNVTLLMSEKQGIEIDYCPDCRGIWLDRGELDKIIERSASVDSTNYQPDNKNYGQNHRSDHDNHHGDNYHYKYGKRKGFLSELFD